MSALRGAAAAEWLKLRSVRSTWWTLGATAALVATYAAIVGLSASASAAKGVAGVPRMSPLQVAEAGMFLAGQLGLATLGVLAMAGEYATGSILPTLQWVPVRRRMLLGKLLVAAPVCLAAGAAVALLGVGVGAVTLGSYAEPWSVPDALATGGALGVYSAAVAVIAVGLGAVLRSVAGSMGVALLLLLVLPQALAGTGIDLLVNLAGYFPGPAGRALLGSGEGAGYGPATGALVLSGWAAAAWTAGAAALSRRDAL